MLKNGMLKDRKPWRGGTLKIRRPWGQSLESLHLHIFTDLHLHYCSFMIVYVKMYSSMCEIMLHYTHTYLYIYTHIYILVLSYIEHIYVSYIYTYICIIYIWYIHDIACPHRCTRAHLCCSGAAPGFSDRHFWHFDSGWCRETPARQSGFAFVCLLILPRSPASGHKSCTLAFRQRLESLLRYLTRDNRVEKKKEGKKDKR